jgi:DNA-binding CsgD family transcriptional regulator
MENDTLARATTQQGTISAREMEIVKMVIHGKSSLEIAASLSISQHTVRTHRKNIFKKLGINNKVQLARYFIVRGLLSL